MEIKSGNMTEVIEYIEEREKNLSLYSDKLRDNIEKIFALFGDPEECRICGKNKEEHKRYMVRYNQLRYNELPEKILEMKPKIVNKDFDVGKWGNRETNEIYVEEKEITHEFQPKIFVSIDIDDTETFYEEHIETVDVNYGYFLGFRDHNLWIIEANYTDDTECEKSIGFSQRKVLKELVKSGRLTKFLIVVAERLKRAEEEYKEVSEIAEKLSSSF